MIVRGKSAFWHDCTRCHADVIHISVNNSRFYGFEVAVRVSVTVPRIRNGQRRIIQLGNIERL